MIIIKNKVIIDLADLTLMLAFHFDTSITYSKNFIHCMCSSAQAQHAGACWGKSYEHIADMQDIHVHRVLRIWW